MTHLDYTWEKREKMIYKDGISYGEEKSRNETIQTMLAAGIDMTIILKSGFTMEEIEKAEGRTGDGSLSRFEEFCQALEQKQSVSFDLRERDRKELVKDIRTFSADMV